MEKSIRYFKKWQKNVEAGIFDAPTWQRKERQLVHPDRQWLKENTTEPVLDVGCGGAVNGAFHTDYVGVDVTPSFIHSGKESGVSNLIIADARNLPIREKSFKTSYCKDLLLHMSFEDAVKVLKELVRTGHRAFVAWGIEYIGGERQGKNRAPVKKVLYTPFVSNRFPMKFIRKNRKRGMLNYKDGEIYYMPMRHTNYPWWELVEGGEPEEKNRIQQKKGFWYNRFSRKKLNRYCRIGNVINGTTITEVKEK